MSKAIIRCLFGQPGEECYWSKRDIQQTVRLTNEVEESLKYDWAKNDVIHYVIGEKNVELLEKNGAKNIVLVDKRQSLVPNDDVNPLYNKVFMINEAMKQYDEILFLDFDTLPIDKSLKPDEKMWNLLRAKNGRFGGIFQAPFVNRTRPFCLTIDSGGWRDPSKIFVRKTITTCMVYCRSKDWTKEWLDHFLEYQRAVHKLGGRTLDKHDEYVFMYYLDKNKGVMNEAEIVDAFEPEIMTVAKAYVDSRTKKNLYFYHQ